MNRRGLILFALLLGTIFYTPLSALAEPWHEPALPSSEIVVERGPNYIIKDLGGNKRSWESQPQWVHDGVNWVPYIYYRDEAKKCYSVQVGFVSAKLYDSGVVEMYDPALKEVRVKDETWELWSAGKQATLNTPITWNVITNSSGVFITRQQTTSKPAGLLEIIYIFSVGSGLKHTIKWTSAEKNAVSGVQVKQVHLMDFDRVTTDTGSLTASKSEKSGAYLFGYGLKDFWFLEKQHAMIYNEDGSIKTEKCLLTGDIDFSGKKVTYTFGDWTLTQGTSLVIDPDSATLNDPTEDGYIQYFAPTYTRYNTLTIIRIIEATTTHRGYVEWDVSSIPNAATITNTVFKYHGDANNVDCHIHAIAAAPTGATDAALYADIADGTVYVDPAGFPVAGTNKQVDLGTTADSDLQGQLASADWFAIGIQADKTTALNSRIFSEEYATATPKPTLYVEYDVSGVPTNYPRSATQSLTVSGDADRVFSGYREGTQGISLTPDADRLFNGLRAATQNIMASVDADRLYTALRYATQALTLSSDAARSYQGAREPTQSLGVSTDADRGFTGSRDASQGFVITPDAERIFNALRAGSQGLNIISDGDRVLELNRGAVQGVDISSDADRSFMGSRDASQGVGMGVDGDRVYGSIRGGSQSIGVTPDGERIYGGVRSPTQSFTLSSSTSRALTMMRGASQALSTLFDATSVLTKALVAYVRGATLALDVTASASTNFLNLIIHVVNTIGNALTGANVTVWKASGPLISSGVVNATGYYDVGGVQPGNYTILAEKTSYQTNLESHPITVSTTITMTLQVLGRNINLLALILGVFIFLTLMLKRRH